MSSQLYRNQNIESNNYTEYSEQQVQDLITARLRQKIHGISFSPYITGQGPGTEISEQHIRARMIVIAPYVNWIRSFSCTEGNQLIPKVAKQLGLNTLVGIWLNDDKDKNEIEINNAIEVARAGNASMLAVGNEVLLRDELSEQELIDYINRVKAAAPDIPVGYVDAYFKFVNHPAVTQACDVVFANCYPFWEGYPIDHALVYMKDMYQRAKKVAGNKPVIISETGWPNLGSVERQAEPSADNAKRYFLNAYEWADEENIEMFYFSSFDEAWKVEDEGDVGAYWGLWDENGRPKYGNYD